MLVPLYTLLNIIVCMIACLLLDEIQTPFVIVPLILIEFLWLKQFRLSWSLVFWVWFYYHQRLIPKLIPDFGMLSLLICAIGGWVGLGIERKLNGGTIRPVLTIVSGAIYLLPFQTPMSSEAMAGMSAWYLASYGLLCWIKDDKEEEMVTVFYFLLSSNWVLIASPHWIFILIRIAWSLLLLRIPIMHIYRLQQEQSQHPTPASTATMAGRQKQRKRAGTPFKKREFTARDGWYQGLKMLAEDDFVSAKIYQKSRMERAVDKETIPADDPELLKEQSKFRFV